MAVPLTRPILRPPVPADPNYPLVRTPSPTMTLPNNKGQRVPGTTAQIKTVGNPKKRGMQPKRRGAAPTP